MNMGRVLLAAAVALSLAAPGMAWADYGGQGPITKGNPLIRAEIQHRGATAETQAVTEATTGHLSKNPHDVTIPQSRVVTVPAPPVATQSRVIVKR